MPCDEQEGFSVLSTDVNDSRSLQFTHQPLRRSLSEELFQFGFAFHE